MQEWINGLYKAVDKKDADAFAGYLAEDAAFKFANMPVVSGRENIKESVSGFFGSIKGLSHNVSEWWEKDNAIIMEGEVTYTRHDDSAVTFPFVNVFKMNNELIRDYRIYVDASTLYDVA